jgi:hypothetical protein
MESDFFEVGDFVMRKSFFNHIYPGSYSPVNFKIISINDNRETLTLFDPIYRKEITEPTSLFIFSDPSIHRIRRTGK